MTEDIADRFGAAGEEGEHGQDVEVVAGRGARPLGIVAVGIA